MRNHGDFFEVGNQQKNSTSGPAKPCLKDAQIERSKDSELELPKDTLGAPAHKGLTAFWDSRTERTGLFIALSKHLIKLIDWHKGRASRSVKVEYLIKGRYHSIP